MQEFFYTNYKIIGDNIKKVRKGAKLSQEKFAEILDIERETVSRIENAHEDDRVGLRLLMKIAQIFDVELHKFFIK